MPLSHHGLATMRNFLFSESVRDVAADKGWWKEGEPLDFTKL